MHKCFVFLGSLLPLAMTLQAGAARADVIGSDQLSATFSVPATTEVPGKNLKAGDYKIVIVDHLADRVIVRIEDSKGKSEGVFLALPNRTIASSKATGPIPWSGGPNKALRGFAFPQGAIEFVYPKEEAVSIAKANSEKVPAIDPKSEGRPSANKLSDEDRQMVSLWMLSSTRINAGGGSEPAIAAEHYVAPQSNTVVAAARQSAAPRQTDSVEPTSPTNPATPRRAVRATPRTQVAELHRPARISELPHTASSLPLAFLAAVVGLGGAAAIRFARRHA